MPHSDGDGTAEPDSGWLLLIYRVPSEPTRLRATVWRRIKSMGAIYLQNSAAALPASVTAERALRKLRSEILDMSGTAVLLSCSVLAGEPDRVQLRLRVDVVHLPVERPFRQRVDGCGQGRV